MPPDRQPAAGPQGSIQLGGKAKGLRLHFFVSTITYLKLNATHSNPLDGISWRLPRHHARQDVLIHTAVALPSTVVIESTALA